jgi:hypothetical protein
VTFDDSAFAITSAIPRAAAIPMYNGERGTDTKKHVQNSQMAVGAGCHSGNQLFWGTTKEFKK